MAISLSPSLITYCFPPSSLVIYEYSSLSLVNCKFFEKKESISNSSSPLCLPSDWPAALAAGAVPSTLVKYQMTKGNLWLNECPLACEASHPKAGLLLWGSGLLATLLTFFFCFYFILFFPDFISFFFFF